VAALTYSWLTAEAYLILETEKFLGQDFLRLNYILSFFGTLTQHLFILWVKMEEFAPSHMHGFLLFLSFLPSFSFPSMHKTGIFKGCPQN
jgi:hypothetical protein